MEKYTQNCLESVELKDAASRTCGGNGIYAEFQQTRSYK